MLRYTFWRSANQSAVGCSSHGAAAISPANAGQGRENNHICYVMRDCMPLSFPLAPGKTVILRLEELDLLPRSRNHRILHQGCFVSPPGLDLPGEDIM